MLRDFRAPGSPDIHGVHELDLSGTSDEVLFGELHKRQFSAMVTKDSAILSASIRREAWKATRLSLFVMQGSFGNLSLFELTRCLIWWWPDIVRETLNGQPPTAWTIKRTMSGSLEPKR